MHTSQNPHDPEYPETLAQTSRRAVVRTGVLAGAAVLAGGVPAFTPAGQGAAAAAPTPASGPFRHGVASGDPHPDGVLLWTRVTPTDEAVPGSGAGPDVTVSWIVALDPDFTRVAARGTVRTGAGRDHTVKVPVSGLAPATEYWFRFRTHGGVSPAGRTRTAPAAGAAVDHLRFGVVSCANWQAGHFSAYRHLSRERLDAVLHLGDYLYEYAPGEYQARDAVVRPHEPAREMTTLADYRARHGQYKTDPDLQRLHAAAPFIVTWDDHESANDAYDDGAENHTEGAEGSWRQRRAWAQQAYAEWMPVRYEPGETLYRRLHFGSLASLSMLDLRTYRDQQASSQLSDEIDDPDRSITGQAQMDWLLAGLVGESAQWKLVGNPVMITPVRFPSTLNTAELQGLHELLGTTTIDGVPYNVDQWDGYVADRNRVIRHLRDHGVKDTVFLTGDIHSGWACDLPADPLTYPLNRESVATELVCTSVTSDNLDDILGVPPRTASLSVEAAIRASNPHVRYLDFDSHGYSVLDVTAAGVRMDWYRLDERTSPGSGASRTASYDVAAGTQRVRSTGGVL
ncbi:MAG: alkaline phosphatase D family protein [Micrococcus sp.]|nr:alkaline phosphatase D family protein [Micrococcus sp.]